MLPKYVKYAKTTGTCPECLKEYGYEYWMLLQCSDTEDTLYCPWCHKLIRYSQCRRYGQTWKVFDGVKEPLDNHI